jgi:hypothetical protein
MSLVVDLTEVMYIDSVGEEVLTLLKRLGSQFVAETSYSKDVCERLDLPLAGKDKSNTPVSAGSNRKGTDGNLTGFHPATERDDSETVRGVLK